MTSTVCVIGQKSFKTDILSYSNMSKGKIYESLIQKGFTLTIVSKNKPSEGFNKVVFSKPVSVMMEKDAIIMYAEYEIYNFNFKDSDDSKPSRISYSHPNKELINQLKSSFKMQYPSLKLTTNSNVEDCYSEETPFNINEPFIVSFLDCSYEYEYGILKDFICEVTMIWAYK